MAAVAKRFPDDLDAATLYAESMMDLHPWDLWTPDGKPVEGTEEIVAVLESVMRRDPNHPGANHYYIHAVEASPNPDRALPSAARLESLVPVAGHLVHMPAHIYLRTGDYAGAVKRNEAAASVDRDYIQACGIKGVYPLLYYSHNLHFLAIANALQGRMGDALKAADKLIANVEPAVKEVPLLEGFLPTRALILVTFERWQDILKLPEPDASLKQARAAWHFSRGIALAAIGKLPEAEAEQGKLQALAATIPPEVLFTPLNKGQTILKIADLQLKGAIARGRADLPGAIAFFQQAAEVEDTLHYDEPPDWYVYSREALGNTLLQAKDPARAEQVFREDLRRNPRKGRALYGLQLSLEAQGNHRAGALVKRGFETAWQNADSPPALPATR
jgi:tetratricopeptide (TPR) repeat protein